MQPTKQQQQEANNIMGQLGLSKLYLNDKGEFFTDKSLANNSVKFAAEKVCELSPTSSVESQSNTDSVVSESNKSDNNVTGASDEPQKATAAKKVTAAKSTTSKK